MDLVERLELEARSCDARVWRGGYNQQDADLRELLEDAAKQIRNERAWIHTLTTFHRFQRP
jgi:hypothetical protein